MEFKDGKEYRVKLLREVYGHYGVKYGNPGDILILRHQKRYAKSNCVCVVEGHGYGTCFELGVDVELVTDSE